MANNAKMIDIGALISAGINPKTGLPIKASGQPDQLESDMRKLLRIKDEQEAVNRYTWFNTALTINSNMLERFIYYRYRLAYFFFNGHFWVMPFTLAGRGTLDFYNIENEITPIPYNSSASKETKAILSSMTFRVVKEPLINPTKDDMLHSAVIIKDYTPQSDINNAIPRATLQDGIISLQASIMPYMRTNLMNATGVVGVKVSDQQEANDVIEGAGSVNEYAKKGIPWIPITQKLDRQPLSGSGSAESASYLQAFQSIDNLRQSFLGINKSGIYDKSQYVNASQTAMNAPVGFPLSDGLKLRQDACDIINSIWGVGISCETSETALSTDTDGDMVADDSEGGTVNEPDQEDEPKDNA